MQNNDIQQPNSDPSADNGTKPHVICSGAHTWDKFTGIREAGKPHIGIKSKWVRTCHKCGQREVFSSGIFNGWYSE